jgi:hypothetical protein
VRRGCSLFSTLKENLVAGDRLTSYSRHENEELISLGVWRINMLKSMKKYVDEVRSSLEQNAVKTATPVNAGDVDLMGDKLRGDP